METLLSIAIALCAGLLVSRFVKPLKLPAVTGYLIAGILIGPYCLGKLGVQGLGFPTTTDVKALSLFNDVALGFIAFAIGNEFRVSQLKTMGKQAITVGILQAVITTIVVDIALIVLHLINPTLLSLPSAIPLGAIAAATAPAATLMVVRQYKADGPLTKLLLMVVAIDDAVGLVLFSVSFGIAGGIEKANKVMMPVLFALFLALGVYIFTLDGSSDGYKYILTINPKGLADPKLWIYAFGQAFFSLSVAGNGSVIYGSYLSREECIPSSARNVAIFDTLAALLAAFVIIPAMATGGAQLDTGGPGLMFIFLVNVINGMAGGRIVGIVFFVCVCFAGISSIINLYEAPVAFLQEKFKLKRVPATTVIHVLGCAVALCIQAIVSEWMDVVSIYICPLGALIAAVMFFWIGGKKFALDAVNLGARKPIGKWFYPLGKYVYCACALIALIAGAALGGIG